MNVKALIAACTCLLALSQPVLAGNHDRCSLRELTGRWMFATGIGHQAILPGGDITALGTFRVSRDGKVNGSFDATVQDFRFLPAVAFEGTLEVRPDCTGTLIFVTSAGTQRTDSIVVLSPWRIRGMSQDPANLWTYDMERL